MRTFNQKVLQVVKKIPRGEVLSYKEVAEKAGRPRAWRVVAQILKKNHNPKIPCHRVIKSNKEIGGFNQGKRKKISLLRKEGVVVKKGKVFI